MIDTHCHLLPGLDDGARSQAEAIRMARRLVEFGIHRVVCTPHYSQRFQTSVPAASRRLAALREVLQTLRIGLALDLAAELSPELAVLAPDEEIVTRSLPGGYAIVELVPTTTAEVVDGTLERFANLDLLPIFAHPERCRAVQRQPTVLDDARAAGAFVQVVAASLTGQVQDGVAAAAWNLIESGRADLLATDAHRPHTAQIQLRSVASVVARRYGGELAETLTSRNPALLLEKARV